MSSSHTQHKQFHIAPIDRQFVGAMIGARGSKIKQTASQTGVDSIYYDRTQSLFKIKGGARACERAINALSDQLAELISKKIQRKVHYKTNKYSATEDRKAPNKKSNVVPKKRNAFAGLLGEDGRTVEEIEEADRLAKEKARQERLAKKREKKHELENGRKFIVGGISWADDFDSDEEDDEE